VGESVGALVEGSTPESWTLLTWFDEQVLWIVAKTFCG
jgi:hypothetical protein